MIPKLFLQPMANRASTPSSLFDMRDLVSGFPPLFEAFLGADEEVAAYGAEAVDGYDAVIEWSVRVGKLADKL